MFNKYKSTLTNEKGIALAVCIVITVIISILGFAVLAKAQAEVSQTVRKRDYFQAQYFADSVAEIAANQIINRIQTYELAYDDWQAETDATAKATKRSAMIQIGDDLVSDIIPDTASDTETFTIRDGGDSYTVTISREHVRTDTNYEEYYLVVEARATNPATASSKIRVAKFSQETFPGDAPPPSSLDEGYVTSGDLTFNNGSFDLNGGISIGGSLSLFRASPRITGNIKTGKDFSVEGSGGTEITGHVQVGRKIYIPSTATATVNGNVEYGTILDVYPGRLQGTGDRTQNTLLQLNQPDNNAISAEIITPELVWYQTNGHADDHMHQVTIVKSYAGSGQTIPIANYSGYSNVAPPSSIASTITSANSGYYGGEITASAWNKTYVVDLKDGSVVLVFDKMTADPITFWVQNTGAATSIDREGNTFDHCLYIFVREHYGGATPLSSKTLSNTFLNPSGNLRIRNCPSVSEVRTFLIALNDGSQKYFYETLNQTFSGQGMDSYGNVFKADEAVDTNAPLPGDLKYRIPASDPILLNPSSYSDYYDIVEINQFAHLEAHIVAPLCNMTIRNGNGPFTGTLRAATLNVNAISHAFTFANLNNTILHLLEDAEEPVGPNQSFNNFRLLDPDGTWLR